ncbi:hypothetical protein OROGR_019687 [Orobanche gracilis]
MRKKLDTRFPAARIKKIMQADEDVGKIAMAVPLLVSKALELFLQDLCDRTYEITLKRGAKTVNSLHLKQCVESCNVFDFLKDTVSKVPDLGGSDATTADDKSATKKRKISEDEDGNGDEPKRTIMHEISHVDSNGRGRGRDRGRGRGRGKRTLEIESIVQDEKHEDLPDSSNQNDKNQKQDHPVMWPDDNIPGASVLRFTSRIDADKPVKNFDLNVELNEIGESSSTLAGGAPCASLPKLAPEMKHEDIIPGWSLDDVERMTADPVQLASLNGGVDEEYEDYDEED